MLTFFFISLLMPGNSYLENLFVTRLGKKERAFFGERRGMFVDGISSLKLSHQLSEKNIAIFVTFINVEMIIFCRMFVKYSYHLLFKVKRTILSFIIGKHINEKNTHFIIGNYKKHLLLVIFINYETKNYQFYSLLKII